MNRIGVNILKGKHGWNMPRRQDTYLRAFYVGAILGGHLLITYTTVIYCVFSYFVVIFSVEVYR